MKHNNGLMLWEADEGLHAHEAKLQLNKYFEKFAASFLNEAANFSKYLFNCIVRLCSKKQIKSG